MSYIIHGSLLDSLWRGLVAATLSSSLLLVPMSGFAWLTTQTTSPLPAKRLLNFQLSLLFLVFLGTFLFTALTPTNIALECFHRIVKPDHALTSTRVLASAWLLGVLILASLDTFKIRRSARSPHLRRLEQPSIEKLFTPLLARLCPNRAVSLHMTEESVSPYVQGFLRHRIVVPQTLLENTRVLRDVFAHELIHVRDRDALWSLLAHACRRLLFFHPFMHFIARRHLVCLEKAADDQAVRHGGADARGLLSSLLEVASLGSASSLSVPRLGVSRSFHEMKERIESLARFKTARRSPWPFRVAAALSLFMAFGISLAQADMSAAWSKPESAGHLLPASVMKHHRTFASWLGLQAAQNRCEQ